MNQYVDQSIALWVIFMSVIAFLLYGIDMSSFHHACFRNSNPQSGNGILAGFRLQPSARFSALAAYADSFDAPQDVRYFLFCRGQRTERLIVSKKKRSDSALIVLVVSSWRMFLLFYTFVFVFKFFYSAFKVRNSKIHNLHS